MKKFLLLLAAVLVATAAFAQKSLDGVVFGYSYHGSELHYRIWKDHVTVTSEVKSVTFSKVLEIPSEVKYEGKTYKVVGFENYGIVGATNVEKIIVPGSFRRVKLHSFKDCPNLRELVVEDGVESISGEPFEKCPKIKKVTIPANCEVTNGDWYEKKNVKIIRR